MSSNRDEPRSIARQLVLLFTLCSALLLSCSLGIFYWIVVRHAFEEDNAVLADKLSAIRTELKQPEGISTLDLELKNLRASEPAVYWIRVVGPTGSVVTETPRMNDLLPTNVFPTPPTSTSSSSSIKDYQENAKLFSLISVNENVDAQTSTVQSAQARSTE